MPFCILSSLDCLWDPFVALNLPSFQAASSSSTRALSCSTPQPSASGSSRWTSWFSTAPSPTSLAPSPARPWWWACSRVTTSVQGFSWAPGPEARQWVGRLRASSPPGEAARPHTSTVRQRASPCCSSALLANGLQRSIAGEHGTSEEEEKSWYV